VFVTSALITLIWLLTAQSMEVPVKES